MRGLQSPLTPLTLVTLLWAAASGQQSDPTVTSVHLSSQILPCSFPRGDDLLVHWLKDGVKDPVVHTYYDGKDQLDHQYPHFQGRTSLFKEQLSRGNASLLLEKVQVSDRGRYTCYTSSSSGRQETSIYLEVEAPVTKVSISEEGDRVTCRSEGIYPKPQVTWSKGLSGDTTPEQTDKKLFNVRSSVMKSEEHDDFTCYVTSSRSSGSATLTPAGDLRVLGPEGTLDCPAQKPPLMSVTWRVNNSVVGFQRGDRQEITEGWRDHVKDLSPSGSLTLQKLFPDLSGVYTCEVVKEKETHVKSHAIRVEMDAGADGKAASASWIIPVVVFISLLVLALLTVALLFWRNKRSKQGGDAGRKGKLPAKDSELQSLKMTGDTSATSTGDKSSSEDLEIHAIPSEASPHSAAKLPCSSAQGPGKHSPPDAGVPDASTFEGESSSAENLLNQSEPAVAPETCSSPEHPELCSGQGESPQQDGDSGGTETTLANPLR